MRWIRVSGLVCAGLAGGSLAACNLLLGLDGYTGGTGGTSSSSGMGASGSGGLDGGGADGSDASKSDGDGGTEPVETGGEGLWAQSFAGSTAAAIAVGADGAVYVTGTTTDASAFNCDSTFDGGAMTGTGFLVQLDGDHGHCLWGFFFGPSAQGTGVAVSPSGIVALTGTFTSQVTILPGATFTAQMTDSFVAGFDPMGGLHPKWATQITDDVVAGNQQTTGVALNASFVAVSGSFTGSLGVEAPSMTTPTILSKPITSTVDGSDAFAIRFDVVTGAYVVDYRVESPMFANADQFGMGVALDQDATVALVGTTSGATLFDTASGTGQTPDTSGGDIFLAATQEFNTIFDGGTLAQAGRAVAFDSFNNIVAGGDFASTVGFGGTGPTYTANGRSAILASFNSLGELQGSLQLGSASPSSSDTMTIAGIAPWPVLGFSHPSSPAASVVVAGSFTGSVVSFIDAGTTELDGGGSSAAYVAKLAPTLNSVTWARSLGDGMTPQTATAVAVGPADGSVFVAGQFEKDLAFGGDAGTLTGSTTPALFVAKLRP